MGRWSVGRYRAVVLGALGRHDVQALVALSATALGGCGTTRFETEVLSPGRSTPGEMGFGKGLSGFKTGDQVAVFANTVVVASGSEVKGPSELDEGDWFWQVHGNVVRHCHWNAKVQDDCRYASFERDPNDGLSIKDAGFFGWTFVENGNLGSAFSSAANGGVVPASVTFVNGASRKTAPMTISASRTVWLAPTLLGMGFPLPVFRCSLVDETPRCQALPIRVTDILGVFTLKVGESTRSVIWLEGGTMTDPAEGVRKSLYRCEELEDGTVCQKAEEASK